MKWSKLILGSIALLTTLISAIGASNGRYNQVWYLNAQHQQAKAVVAFTCPPGHFGCLGSIGPSAGRQLFQDPGLTIPLGYKFTK